MSPVIGGSEGVSGDSPSHRNRLRRFTDVLGTKKIDLRQLRRLAFHGIPDKDGMRATAWKVRPSACMRIPNPLRCLVTESP